MQKNIFLFLTFITIQFIAFGQQQVLQKKSNKEYTLSGKVTDKETSEELIGVNIYVESDKLKGTITDFEGNYSLKVNEGDVVIFRYVGFQDDTVVVTGDQELNIQMGTETLVLNNVVVSASRRKEKILDAPASISIIDASTIEKKVSTDVGDHLKNVSGVYMQKTGINSGSPSIRGFSGYFSTDVLTITDYRIAKLPNTGLTQYQMLTTSDDDIERVEVLRGPAAALYGPNASNGVIHIITKSPIDYQKLKITTSIGFRQKIKGKLPLVNDALKTRYDEDNLFKRGIYTVSVYLADTIMVKNPKIKLGYKISSKYFRALDWKYNDPSEPKQVIKFKASSEEIFYLRSDGTIDPNGKGDLVDNERDEQINNGMVDARFDIRIKDDINLVFNGGFTLSNGVIASPVGALQNEGWKYYYAQTRFSWKDLFAQFYINGNNSGNSYFVPVGGMYVDNSKVYGLQLQHASNFLKRVFLVYGADMFWNRPDTKGSVNGKNEDKDNFDEYGIYFQGDYRIHPRFNIVFATRFDYNNVNRKINFSPKLAVVYKPGTGQNLRFTFNRAFKNPGTAAYFVDAKQAEIPEGIQVRNIGTPRDGLHYSFANNPYYNNQLLPQFRSPYGYTMNTYYNVGDGSINNMAWTGIKNAIKNQFLTQFGFAPTGVLAQAADGLINALAPATIPDYIGHEVKNLNTTTQLFEKNTTWEKTKDIPGLKPTTTYSYELGYKGLLFKMLGLSLDVYRTDFKNYVAPVTMTTPTVQFNAEQLLDVVGPQILSNYNDPANSVIKSILDGLLDTRADLGGNNNGSGSDELLALFKKALENLPIGVITTKETNGPNMLLITRNIGDLTIYGLDFAANAYLSKNIVLSTNYSWIDKDQVEIEDAVFSFIALNAPKHKFNIGLNYFIEKIGLNIGARWQYNSGFNVNSGNFVGYQKATHDMDLDISYTPKFKFLKEKFNVGVSVQNIYSNKQQRLIGSPVIGTTGIVKMSYAFN